MIEYIKISDDEFVSYDDIDDFYSAPFTIDDVDNQIDELDNLLDSAELDDKEIEIWAELHHPYFQEKLYYESKITELKELLHKL